MREDDDHERLVLIYCNSCDDFQAFTLIDIIRDICKERSIEPVLVLGKIDTNRMLCTEIVMN